METYTTYTNEELVSIIATGDEAAYEQLFRNLAPITLHEAELYCGKMDTYSTEDFLQEGNIVAWEIISRGNYKQGISKFSTYFCGAVRRRLIRLWRDYTLKNPICIEENKDRRGNIKYDINRRSARSRSFRCFVCGVEFKAYGVKTRKYCSHRCYIQGRFYGGKELNLSNDIVTADDDNSYTKSIDLPDVLLYNKPSLSTEARP